jgi:hypothetical protein
LVEAGLAGVWTAASAAAGAAAAFPPKILNITVPQVGHLPLMALRPFFIVSSTASMISFFALHLTQYPSGIKIWLPDASCAAAVMEIPYWAAYPSVNMEKE